jgi:hypothetical protein
MSNAAEAFLRARRAAVAGHATQIGLDFIEVAPDPGDPGRRRLVLHFIPAEDVADAGKHGVLGGLTADNLRFTAAGVPLDVLFTVVDVDHQTPSSPEVTVTVVYAGDADVARRLGSETVFTLELVNVPVLDPFFSRLDFSLDPDAPRAEDCADACPPRAAETLPLASDYLAKDWSSFRQRMLDSLSGALPEWRERSPADLLVTLVELLADAADRASYYQDAVATEAYLGTARLRTSVRRHARLLGYRVGEGMNARVWVCFTASGTGMLPKGTQLLTRVSGLAPVLPAGPELTQALVAGPVVFETLHGVQLRPEQNAIPLYGWGAPAYGLPRGATAATLAGELSVLGLAPGDVLLFEEVLGPESGSPGEENPEHRHAVRLTRVTARQDALAAPPVDLTEVEWDAADALPFPLCITSVEGDGTPVTGVSVARGNVALADQGLTVPGETLTAASGRYRPVLARRGLTFSAPYDHEAAKALPAAAALVQEPGEALPAIELREGPALWELRRDLLTSDRFARDFMVETEDGGTAVLRFGDGTLGRAPEPGTELEVAYRVGNGRLGNLGADSLAHVVIGGSGGSGPTFAAAVRNPLPAQGGTDPEPLDSVRLAAPGRLRALEGRTAETDFARLAETHPEVARAAASLRWTGSWFLLEVAAERTGGLPTDEAFLGRVRTFLEDWRQAAWEIVVRPLRFVGLDIAVTVLLTSGVSRGAVERALLAGFSNRDLPDGGKGFFHPANFTFGQPVYLSRIVEAALAVEGVQAVDVSESPPRLNRFRRWGEPSRGELGAGRIRMSRAEIARVDNDPAVPENGRIQFYLEGGR